MYAATLANGDFGPIWNPFRTRNGNGGKASPPFRVEYRYRRHKPAVQKILQLCIKAGATDIPVLIYGETGTGKELAARRIHEASPRPRVRFRCKLCGPVRIPVESELFGHVKGPLRGPPAIVPGKFVAASG